MISVSVEFQSKSFDQVLAALLTLPPHLRPAFFGENEDDPSTRQPIQNIHHFILNHPNAGFVLFGDSFDCDISLYDNKANQANCNVHGGPDVAKHILCQLASARPVFGYACLEAERLHCNRLITKQGINTIES